MVILTMIPIMNALLVTILSVFIVYLVQQHVLNVPQELTYIIMNVNKIKPIAQVKHTEMIYIMNVYLVTNFVKNAQDQVLQNVQNVLVVLVIS